MSLVLRKHQQRIDAAVLGYQAAISEIEGDLRLRAMSNDATDAELALLQRLKSEKAQMLHRYENLREAFKAIFGDIGTEAIDPNSFPRTMK
ncbi:hypothetical protein [Rhizobium sp. LC145]|uniref:hypothetical protein n=1 Tax=Rhizobium sp. LC145 TaxID=1120688 RepID=UPI0009E62D48|nr:hypothetical protein [Rhizobium sp. LC145]TKT42804.1 hypothetical protein FDR95_28120 [Rhizobiaceae bacterium LC148]